MNSCTLKCCKWVFCEFDRQTESLGIVSFSLTLPLLLEGGGREGVSRPFKHWHSLLPCVCFSFVFETHKLEINHPSLWTQLCPVALSYSSWLYFYMLCYTLCCPRHLVKYELLHKLGVCWRYMETGQSCKSLSVFMYACFFWACAGLFQQLQFPPTNQQKVY